MELGFNHIHRIYGFQPLLCDEPRILILGTLPQALLAKYHIVLWDFFASAIREDSSND